jgi:hypothetical protein
VDFSRGGAATLRAGDAHTALDAQPVALDDELARNFVGELLM